MWVNQSGRCIPSAKVVVAARKGIRKEWSSMEPKLIEMAHKLEDNGLIENKYYIWLKERISNGYEHSYLQLLMLTIYSVP